MNRPYVICHMTTSINGKVTGDFLSSEAGIKACEVYYDLNRSYLSDGFACGRVTMEGSFTGGYAPDLSQYENASCDYTDWFGKELRGPYAIAFDPHGRLGWQSNRIIDPDGDPGYDNARIVEVLTEQVDQRYLRYLTNMNIPYIFAGEKEIDIETALYKLRTFFGIERLLLEGGSILNGAFMEADVIDELSLVVCLLVAAEGDKPLFDRAITSEFEFAEVKAYAGGVLWLNYMRERL